MASHWVPEQSASHDRLLDSSRRPSSRDRFDAIVVPTNCRAESLTARMELALETLIPLIVISSKLVRSCEVIRMAEAVGIKAYALDLPADGLIPWRITFETSEDKVFHAHAAESLGRHDERDDETDRGRQIRAAEASVRAARERLEGINAELCHKFVQLWQADLVQWRNYLTALGCFDSIRNAFQHLELDYAESLSPSIR